MKPFILVSLTLLLALTVSTAAAGRDAVTPYGVMLPLPIPDGHPGGIVSQMWIYGCDTVEDLDVTLGIDHEWTGDLVVTLESPAGTLVTLVDRPGFDGSGYGCQFAGLWARLDDEAAPALEDQCTDDMGGTVPAIGGTLSPGQPLAAFDGELGSGVWTLRVSDWAEQNSGTLVVWEMHLDCSSRDVDLQPKLHADRGWAMPGETVIFSLQLVNAGSEPASGVEALYDLPQGLEIQWAEPGALYQDGLITQRHGHLDPGQWVSAQLAVTVTTGQWGPQKVTAQVRADQTDSNPWDDQVIAGVYIGPGPSRPSGQDGEQDTRNVETKP